MFNLPQLNNPYGCFHRALNCLYFCILNLFIIWQGKSEPSDWFFLGQDFTILTVSMETIIGCVLFAFESQQIQNKHGPSAL